MSYSDHRKVFKQLRVKTVKLKKFVKHNAPKERKSGRGTRRCRRCGRIRGHIKKYGLNVCRQCFREIATKLGFKKFS
jgi:small subunit ribosomal protein S14